MSCPEIGYNILLRYTLEELEDRELHRPARLCDDEISAVVCTPYHYKLENRQDGSVRRFKIPLWMPVAARRVPEATRSNLLRPTARLGLPLYSFLLPEKAEEGS